jgi:hypothetical protein
LEDFLEGEIALTILSRRRYLLQDYVYKVLILMFVLSAGPCKNQFPSRNESFVIRLASFHTLAGEYLSLSHLLMREMYVAHG